MLRYLISLIIVGSLDAISLSKVFNRGNGEGLLIAPRNGTDLGKSALAEAPSQLLLKRSHDACEKGWIKYGSSCYYFSKRGDKLSWPDALLQCRAIGGYLAEIHNREENVFIEKQAQLLGSAPDPSTRLSAADCRNSFLTGPNGIPDSALSASSSYSSNHGPDRGRLNTVRADPKMGAWVASSPNEMQWIQADLGRTVEVTGIITQGRPEYDQFVKKFVVYYSLDCSSWTAVTRPDGSEQIFTGNSDRNTQIINMFVQPVKARYIRINPREWNAYAALRFDILGCSLVPDFHLWLGGADIWHENDFRWATSGSRISNDAFHDWLPRQPDNEWNDEHCLMITPLTGWHDAYCGIQNRFVCEKDHESVL